MGTEILLSDVIHFEHVYIHYSLLINEDTLLGMSEHMYEWSYRLVVLVLLFKLISYQAKPLFVS